MKTEEVAFTMFHSVEPEDLITFSEEYKEHARMLLAEAKENIGKCMSFCLIRFNHDGAKQHTTKTCSGRIMGVTNNTVVLELVQYDNIIHETPLEKILRIDNPLGEVPVLLWGDYLNPFIVTSNKKTRCYLQSLHEMKGLLEEAAKNKMKVKLFYRYSVSNPLFREGNYSCEGIVTRVNISNVEYNHLRTVAYVDDENSYADLLPRHEIDRYIAPDRYLQKVVVCEETLPSTHLYDDQYVSSAEIELKLE